MTEEQVKAVNKFLDQEPCMEDVIKWAHRIRTSIEDLEEDLENEKIVKKDIELLKEFSTILFRMVVTFHTQVYDLADVFKEV